MKKINLILICMLFLIVLTLNVNAENTGCNEKYGEQLFTCTTGSLKSLENEGYSCVTGKKCDGNYCCGSGGEYCCRKLDLGTLKQLSTKLDTGCIQEYGTNDYMCIPAEFKKDSYVCIKGKECNNNYCCGTGNSYCCQIAGGEQVKEIIAKDSLFSFESLGDNKVKTLISDFKNLKSGDIDYERLSRESVSTNIKASSLYDQAKGYKEIAGLRRDYLGIPAYVITKPDNIEKKVVSSQQSGTEVPGSGISIKEDLFSDDEENTKSKEKESDSYEIVLQGPGTNHIVFFKNSKWYWCKDQRTTSFLPGIEPHCENTEKNVEDLKGLDGNSKYYNIIPNLKDKGLSDGLDILLILTAEYHFQKAGTRYQSDFELYVKEIKKTISFKPKSDKQSKGTADLKIDDQSFPEVIEYDTSKKPIVKSTNSYINALVDIKELVSKQKSRTINIPSTNSEINLGSIKESNKIKVYSGEFTGTHIELVYQQGKWKAKLNPENKFDLAYNNIIRKKSKDYSEISKWYQDLLIALGEDSYKDDFNLKGDYLEGIKIISKQLELDPSIFGTPHVTIEGVILPKSGQEKIDQNEFAETAFKE
ncbi:hypothetical protein J4216_05390 [Candidatus Woesearchaeota archaeon]|nr:hypothetical protein [Candidatus Woesearchaeota archaeon]